MAIFQDLSASPVADQFGVGSGPKVAPEKLDLLASLAQPYSP